MEEIIHFAYISGLYRSLKYTNGPRKGQEVDIIYKGERNLNGGPDFFNARINLDGVLMVGNIEFHLNASDWLEHKHHLDPSYNNVILHIVENDDCEIFLNGNNAPLLTAKISVDPADIEKSNRCLRNSKAVPCVGRLMGISERLKSVQLRRLGKERLKGKSGKVLRLCKTLCGDWNEVTYILLTRQFGGNVNNDAFEQIAKLLPYSCIRKERNDLRLIEAMLMGTAGLLIGNRDDYERLLYNDYKFLARKFDLIRLMDGCVRFHRIRPPSFPTVKLAKLASLLHKKEFLFSEIINSRSLKDARDIFRGIEISPYWQDHYNFGCRRRKVKNRGLSMADVDHFVCNVVCPVMVAYGESVSDERYLHAAIIILSQMKPETNRITRYYEEAVKAHSVLESQGLIRLYESYCRSKMCRGCPMNR